MMKDLSVLQEDPFTDQGSIVEVFEDLTVWMGIRRVIDLKRKPHLRWGKRRNRSVAKVKGCQTIKTILKMSIFFICCD